MTSHIFNREKIIKQLREELVGPSPAGQEIDCTQAISFGDPNASYGPWRQKGTGEEILLRDPPSKRYGIGVLYPFKTKGEQDEPKQPLPGLDILVEGNGSDEQPSPITEEGLEGAERIDQRMGRRARGDVNDSNDLDLSSANTYNPSSMGVTFLVELPESSELIIEVTGGRYFPKDITVAGKTRQWWLRTPVKLRARVGAGNLCVPKTALFRPIDRDMEKENMEGLDISVEIFSRPQNGSMRVRLVTVCLINRKPAGAGTDRFGLFQAFFKVSVNAPDALPHILPYPGQLSTQLDDEEASLALLYRNAQTFATGHGCAANWGLGIGPTEAGSTEFSRLESIDGAAIQGHVNWVSAECFPVFETPGMTPNITRKDGSEIEVSMAALAGLIPGENGFSALEEVVSLYEEWIQDRRAEITLLDASYRVAAERNMSSCARSAERMRAGLEYLKSNSQALRAFRLANHAILLQQICSRRELRKVSYDAKSQRLQFSTAYAVPDVTTIPSGRGNWRAFQIAFLLMSIKSSVDGTVPERETVELIWFPTGGGKTEAYLGLAAFSMFMQRLSNSKDTGVSVLMRYTLRLLTAQQFQRAANLLCAMDYLRQKNNADLGSTAFSIGIWLGGSTTPNTRKEALGVFSRLRDGYKGTENKFILGRCPWCAAQLGPIEYNSKPPRQAPRVAGYEQRGDTIVFACPDKQCPFSKRIPVYVTDEDIYEERPSMVIGTVDKFAMLAFLPKARALFGLDMEGKRMCSPPNLIIQDELHLISGPLGSMVGLYEVLIEELCSDYRQGDKPIRPKIVSSTATIRRYADQVKALYARSDVALFPPSGLEAGDSFFAQYDRLPDKKLRPGRMYVGVHAPGLGSIQTAQVRTCAALLQAPVALSNEERDPWWTLLLFFNSLRELGTTVSLFQSDIPDYLRVMQNRFGLTSNQLRWLNNILELTGRLRSDEVPEAINALEVKTDAGGDRPVDVCLASNIIEVGVDIDRLSVMSVVGQPKTTSQYIQVTGRVGRRAQERPGLVITIYGASKPRDRSHFEKFRGYHERLYAQVEPTSVTPFSPPALDRALHAIMAAFVRQTGDKKAAERPTPFPEELLTTLKQLVLTRAQIVDATEMANVERVFTRRAREWRQWERMKWEAPLQDADIPMLRMAGAYVTAERARFSWSVPTSMRNVDAECSGTITQLYLQDDDEDTDNV